MRASDYGEGYWERGEGSNYVAYGDDPGWEGTARVLASHASGRLFEAACAQGWFLRAARRHRFDVRGVDISEYAVSKAQADVRDLITLGDVLYVPIRGTFDVVCSWEFLEHVPERNTQDVLGRLLARLRPGGLFVHRIGIETDHGGTDCDLTHVNVRPRDYWEAEFDALDLVEDSNVVHDLDVAFADRDWAGRFFAYRR